MMSPTVSSEFERMWDCGRSARVTSFGARGSLTSTAVKFFGALSWASHRMRRPSLAIWIDMPSPIPPKPSSSWCASCLKFQIAVSAICVTPERLIGYYAFISSGEQGAMLQRSRLGGAQHSGSTAAYQSGSGVEIQHQPQILHRRTRRSLAEIVETGDEHRLAVPFVGPDVELEPISVVERLWFELPVSAPGSDRHVFRTLVVSAQGL